MPEHPYTRLQEGQYESSVPAVADRVAQTVVARELERKVEPIFHPDSYGYRPGRSALDAVAACRSRCWKTDWVIDLDIRKFFDSVPWELVVKAVEANTDLPWVVLYVRRWLQAPLVLPDGSLQVRDRGTPQGSAVSPVLPNLFLHYAFDNWMAREFPGVAVRTLRGRRGGALRQPGSGTAGAGGPAGADARGRPGTAPGQDQGRVLQGQQPARLIRAHRVHLPGVHVPGRAEVRPRTGKRFTGFSPAISSDALKKIRRKRGPGGCTSIRSISEAELAAGRSTRSGARLDEVLRCLLPIGAVFPPDGINAYLCAGPARSTSGSRDARKRRKRGTRRSKRRPRYFAHWAWVTWVPAVW